MKTNQKKKKEKKMSSGQLGLGVMIKMSGGNEESINTLKGAIGKKITKAELDDDVIKIWFGEKGIGIWDGVRVVANIATSPRTITHLTLWARN